MNEPDGSDALDGFLDADLRGSPEIHYPCRWSYKLIGRSETGLRAAVALVLGQQDYRLDRSNRSATGRYCSLALSIVVRDERERRWIGQTLHEHDDVTMVL